MNDTAQPTPTTQLTTQPTTASRKERSENNKAEYTKQRKKRKEYVNSERYETDFQQRFDDCCDLSGGAGGCINWQNTHTIISYRGRLHSARRVAFARHHKRDIDSLRIITMTCGNRWCVNIGHMTEATEKHKPKRLLSIGDIIYTIYMKMPDENLVFFRRPLSDQQIICRRINDYIDKLTPDEYEYHCKQRDILMRENGGTIRTATNDIIQLPKLDVLFPGFKYVAPEHWKSIKRYFYETLGIENKTDQTKTDETKTDQTKEIQDAGE